MRIKVYALMSCSLIIMEQKRGRGDSTDNNNRIERKKVGPICRFQQRSAQKYKIMPILFFIFYQLGVSSFQTNAPFQSERCIEVGS